MERTNEPQRRKLRGDSRNPGTSMRTNYGVNDKNRERELSRAYAQPIFRKISALVRP